MRMIMHVSFPVEGFNTAVRQGSAGETIKKILGQQRPEAAYFTEYGGRRSCILVVEVAAASDIPRFAEPWFLQFNADVGLHPVMSPEDLEKAGLEGMGKAWG